MYDLRIYLFLFCTCLDLDQKTLSRNIWFVLYLTNRWKSIFFKTIFFLFLKIQSTKGLFAIAGPQNVNYWQIITWNFLISSYSDTTLWYNSIDKKIFNLEKNQVEWCLSLISIKYMLPKKSLRTIFFFQTSKKIVKKRNMSVRKLLLL